MDTKNLFKIIFIGLWIVGCNAPNTDHNTQWWTISVLPSSVRQDPSSGEIIDHRFVDMAATNLTVEIYWLRIGFMMANKSHYMAPGASISRSNW